MLQPGQPLPSFSAKAAVSGRDVDPGLFAGRRGLIVVHGSKNGEVGKNLSKAVRAKHPDFSKVVFVSIVDLRAFSGMWKKVADAQVKATYTKLAEKVTAAGGDPTMAVIIVPDWDGAISARFGVEKPEESPMAFAVEGAPAGAKVLGVTPAGQVEAAIALV